MNRVVKILVCIFTILALFVILGVAVNLRSSQDNIHSQSAHESIQFELLEEVTFHINPQKPDSSLEEQNEKPDEWGEDSDDLEGWGEKSPFILLKISILLKYKSQIEETDQSSSIKESML